MPYSPWLAASSVQAVGRADVQRALRAESEALCRTRSPRSRFQWQEPPRRPQDVKAQSFPLLEEPDLLSDPNAVERSEQQLLQGGQSPQ